MTDHTTAAGSGTSQQMLLLLLLLLLHTLSAGAVADCPLSPS